MRTIHSFAAALVVLLAPAAPAFAQEFSIALGPNPSCGGTMRPITALEAFEHQDAICKRLGLDEQWGIWGIGGGGAMGGQGYGCNIFKKWPQGPINGPTICTARTAAGARTFAAQTLSLDGDPVGLAADFAPVLKFDRAAARYGLPMSAQPFFNALKKENGVPVRMPGNAPMGIENKDSATLANRSIPTYYQLRTFRNQVRIRYWWFYGYQHACYRDEGAHNGDWENIIVILTEDRKAVAAVVYYQHGGWYTRIAGPRDAPCTPGGTGRCGFSGFRTEGKRPVVYVGKISHGSFHDDNASGPGALQAPNPGEGDFTNCSYYGDYRNPGSPADWLHTQHNLVDLDLYDEPWMLVDNILPNGRQAEWIWGPDGISNHPKQKPPPQDLAACEGTPTWDTGKDRAVGCYKSECYAGDDQASEHCLKECKPDYTNHGLTCWKSAFHLYGRLQGDHWYRYNYTLPNTDAGLSRRRRAINDDESEWDVP